MSDFFVFNEGTVVSILPATTAAKKWIKKNVFAEPYQWVGHFLIADRRYIGPILEAMLDEGFKIRYGDGGTAS